MQVNYTPTFADYWALNVFVLRRQFRWILHIAALLLLLFVVYPLMRLSNGEQPELLDAYRESLGLLILPAIVVFVFIATYAGARKRWSQSEELRDPRVYKFDDHVVHVLSKSLTVSGEWTVVREAIFTRTFVYLIISQQQFYFFPASVVADVDQLRQLVRSKVSIVKMPN